MMRRRWRGKVNILEADEVFVDGASILDPADRLERKLERPLGRVASLSLLLLIACGMSYLASRAAGLQVREGTALFSRSQENRFSVRPIFAPRGIIADRNGALLVENIASFGLVFDRTLFQRENGDPEALERELMALAPQPGPVRDEISANLAVLSDPTAAPRTILARDIPADLVVAVSSHLDQLPGVQIFESWRRAYKNPYAFSHLLGFVGKVSADDIRRNPDFAREETAGKSGIEAFYDEYLRGESGRKIVEVDSQGIATRYKLTREALPGDALSLTIDGGLQEAAYAVVQGYTAAGRGASIVAVDPRSGAVRALVSSPGFDANRFGAALPAKEFNAILRAPLSPLFNRAVAGEFPSGSTIKPLLASAALEQGIIDPEKKIYDEGFIAIPNPYRPGEQSVFLDWRKHGWVNMEDAIAMSANVYFYMIGGGWRDQQGLGIQRIRQYESAFGLGALSGIDFPGERPGLIPGPEWKKSVSPEDPTWRIGDTYNASIGQGGTKVTPLQMAMAISVIANGGTLWRPYIMERISDKDGAVVRERRPEAIRRQVIRDENLAIVRRGMRQTVTAGTARLLQDAPVLVAAKTGTAQSAPGKLPHAWVTVFAPDENPEIVLVVMVEHAGEGSTVAVPITRDILNWYFTHRHAGEMPSN